MLSVGHLMAASGTEQASAGHRRVSAFGLEVVRGSMTERLKGKVALVTAAGQGIGRAIATAFSDEDATVIATDVDDSKLQGLQAKQRIALDVLSAEKIDALANVVVKEFGGLNVLVNVAGYVHHGNV